MRGPDWIEHQILEWVADYGAVPPPWVMFPNTHPDDIHWRMGAGESYVMVFDAWWTRQKQTLDESQRIEYFRAWPPPPRWLTWLIDVLWDLQPEDENNPESFDYSPYFIRVEALGFGTQAEFERDLADPKWPGEDALKA